MKAKNEGVELQNTEHWKKIHAENYLLLKSRNIFLQKKAERLWQLLEYAVSLQRDFSRHRQTSDQNR